MNIYVVKTCDGDVYFSATAKGKDAAVLLAARTVMNDETWRCGQKERESVRSAYKGGSLQRLMDELLRCGAVRIGLVND